MEILATVAVVVLMVALLIGSVIEDRRINARYDEYYRVEQAKRQAIADAFIERMEREET